MFWVNTILYIISMFAILLRIFLIRKKYIKKQINIRKTTTTTNQKYSYVLPQHDISVCLQILQNTTSLKMARKVHETLRRIIAGLIVNQEMTAESILLLSYGLVSENLPLLTEKEK